ncbi:MAG TPA: carboxypeptidase regulatory-like domain-containing protein [Pyrinomonadaceae bacterium]|nr:carboxypeptidase regulatory-like domain-containing protein [Pyrinomonadaceae bacterium]
MRTPRNCFQLLIVLALCAFALIRVAAQEPSRTSRPTDQKPGGASVIRGRVIYADTGRPLRRAEVTLVDQVSESWAGDAVTDRNGDFALYQISAGRYFVFVRAPDIISTAQRSRRDSISRMIVLGQIEDGFSEVTVDGRNSVKTEIRASRGGVITGRVLTESDEPIANAQIKLFQVEKNGKLRLAITPEAWSEEEKWMFETDSRGVYRIAGLRSGEYIVRASESNEGGNPDDAEEGSYTNGSMMVAFHPRALRVQDATSVRVVQGSETKDVDIRFTERLAHRVSGTVLLKGKPVIGVEIRLTRDEPDDDPARIDFEASRTDSKGQWEIRSVPDGKYKLSISGGYIGYVRVDDQYVSVAPLQREVVVDGGDLTDLKFDLVEGAQVHGTIAIEGGGQLPILLRVMLVTREGESSEKIAEYSFAEKGTFQFSSLPAGSFAFRVSGLGNGHYVKSITANGKDLLRNPTSAEPGNILDNVRILLATDFVSLSGHAIDKDDKSKSLVDAVVLLFPVEIERRRLSEGPIAARTDKDGRFVVKAPPGEYFVVVLDHQRKDGPVTLPAEANLIKNSSSLQKIIVQRADEKKIVEVTGPSQP